LNGGKSYDQLQKELSIGREAVAKWRSRYPKSVWRDLKISQDEGLRQYKEEDKARIVQKAGEKPEGGYTSWSQRRIARESEYRPKYFQRTYIKTR
jgi:transposase